MKITRVTWFDREKKSLMPTWPRALSPINIQHKALTGHRVLSGKSVPKLGARAGIKTGSRAVSGLTIFWS